MDLWVTEAAARRQARLDALDAPVPEPASESKPPCVSHPENASVAACSRCGDFICEVCLIRVEGTELCPRCFEHRVDHAELLSLQRRFRLPSMALGIGIASILCGVVVSYFTIFLGLFAAGVGVKALMDIRRRPALGGKGRAVAGIVLGLIAAIAWTAVFVSVFAFSGRM